MLLLFRRFAKEQRLSLTASLEGRITTVEQEASRFEALKCTHSLISTSFFRAVMCAFLRLCAEKLHLNPSSAAYSSRICVSSCLFAPPRYVFALLYPHELAY